jgi:hypothetical protein
VSQEWHKMLESMLDEENSPEVMNLGHQEGKSGLEGVVPAWPSQNTAQMPAQPAWRIPAWPRSTGLGSLRPGERPRPAGDAGPMRASAWEGARMGHRDRALGRGGGGDSAQPGWVDAGPAGLLLR